MRPAPVTFDTKLDAAAWLKAQAGDGQQRGSVVRVLRSLLRLLFKSPPFLILLFFAVYAFDIGGGRQPIIDGVTSAAHKVGVEMAGRIAPTPSPTPSAVPAPTP